MAGQSSSQAASPFQWWKPALFFLVVIVGLWYVKWQPYYGKAFTAAETHSIGKSILAQADVNPLQAAWDYAMVYFLAVLVLGAARVWLFPHAEGAVDNTLFWVIAMAIAGCLFVIPTAAEIPIVQTMMLAGMGTAPALALLITLPAVSVPSLVMLRKAFPAKALWLTGGLVALCGAIVGALALV
ncbi:hypothetical protein YA25_07910 [Klebsiella aerogenes]|uniref:permease n=1 Tax=Klebsiella aerogenes TaxID=548 RepID=UPI00063CF18C|nr:permease [Klebsiella aerogenes]KLF07464.1 hypothetical protein YA25_07910 [Klebsiella aerogenes]